MNEKEKATAFDEICKCFGPAFRDETFQVHIYCMLIACFDTTKVRKYFDMIRLAKDKQ